MVRKQEKYEKVENYITLAIFGVLASLICAGIMQARAHEKKVQEQVVGEQMKRAETIYHLPPGTSEYLAPIPVIVERHLDSDWIIARGRTNWPTVVYYDGDLITRESIRQVQVDYTGNLSSSSGAEAFEVVASCDYNGYRVAEIFRMTPLLPQTSALFMGVPAKTIAELKAKIGVKAEAPAPEKK